MDALPREKPMFERRPLIAIATGSLGLLLLGAPSALAGDRCGLTEDHTLLLWNSHSADSQAVHDLYLAAHPGVWEFDLDLGYNSIAISRNTYLTTIRQPLLDYLNNTTTPEGVPLAQQIICIVTTRGVPGRIDGQNEITPFPISTFSSVESDLTLLQQDLEQPATMDTPFRYTGLIDNPYHRLAGIPIDSYDRSQITVQRDFHEIAPGAESIIGLTPGDIYLVVRVDAAPGANTTALEEIAALLDRSASLSFVPSQVQALLDEYSCTDQLDDDKFGRVIGTSHDDFGRTADSMTDLGVVSTHDETANFVEASELADPDTPLIVLGSYGENHSAAGCGDDAPGVATYLSVYPNIHPAAVFFSIESFNGNSILNGMPRQGQGQALDFFPAGGSFTIGNVAEPYSYTIPDLEMITEDLFQDGLTFAEAAYASLPVLSWQQTPLGDPLARVHVVSELPGDLNGDGLVDTADLGQLISSFGTSSLIADINGDCTVNTADLGILIDHFGD
jgi:hypothetical protein